jgi:hypothetical protein
MRILGIFLFCGLAYAEPHYSITNLGVTPGNIVTVGEALNNLGDVVGYCTPKSSNVPSEKFPFRYHAGKIENFAAAGAFTYITGEATGINDSGLICGKFYQKFPNPKFNMPYRYLAFIYNGGFKPITDGHHSSAALALNNEGQIVGWYTPLDETLPATQYLNDVHHPFLFQNNPSGWGSFADIYLSYPWSEEGAVWDDSQAVAINDLGQVAGTTYILGQVTGHLSSEAWMYFGGKTFFLRNGIFSSWINNHAQLTGGTSPANGSAGEVGIKIQSGVFQVLPLPSNVPKAYGYQVNAINDAGQAVGQTDYPAIALTWMGNAPYNLNTLATFPGVQLQSAVAINRKGQILCNGTIYGNYRSFLLTPK